jgi:hypothetical protein
LAQREDSDTDTDANTEVVPVVDAIIVEVPIRRRGSRERRRRE